MSYRGTARAVGLLFILATVALSLSVAVLEPVLASPDFLERMSVSSGRVALGSMLELTNHVAVVAIAILIYPVLKLSGERWAVGYVAARSIESVLFVSATMQLLAMERLSHEYVAMGAPANLALLGLAELLEAGHDWNRAPLAFTAFALGSLLLNCSLYRSRLVPRWISVFGLLAAASILGARLVMLAGVDLPVSTVTAMDAPIFLQEMIFAVWLIVRGFDHTVVASASPSRAAGV